MVCQHYHSAVGRPLPSPVANAILRGAGLYALNGQQQSRAAGRRAELCPVFDHHRDEARQVTQPASERLSLRTLFAFALPAAPIAAMGLPLAVYLPPFYRDYMGFGPACRNCG